MRSRVNVMVQCLSVCPINRPLQQHAAGLLLGSRYRSTVAGNSAQQERHHRSTTLSSKREQCHVQEAELLLLLLLKSVEFDDDVALLLSVAGLVVGPHVTSESKIGGTDSAALRTSWTCLRLCGSCVMGCTSFFRGSDPAI